MGYIASRCKEIRERSIPDLKLVAEYKIDD